MNTKIVLTALGLATLVATPAFAQKPTHRDTGPHASAAESVPVVADGYVIGADPDPLVRLEMRRDAAAYLGGD